jgi:hypothetical protein
MDIRLFRVNGFYKFLVDLHRILRSDSKLTLISESWKLVSRRRKCRSGAHSGFRSQATKADQK